MKKALSFLFILALLLTAAPSFAETKHIGPLEFTPESYDLNNGEFWFETDIDGEPTGDSFIMTLYLEDRYEPDEIKSLKKGDTVEVDGKTYTVDVVVIHGWYDSDGDGKTDISLLKIRKQRSIYWKDTGRRSVKLRRIWFLHPMKSILQKIMKAILPLISAMMATAILWSMMRHSGQRSAQSKFHCRCLRLLSIITK